MHARKILGFGLLLALFAAIDAQAADLDQMDGLQLFNKECSVCHGNLARKTGALTPGRQLQVAMSTQDGAQRDFAAPLFSPTVELTPRDPAGVRLAVVPLYGPPLAGIIGRTAGTYSGYAYSESFLKKMNGVVWDEAKLDTWIKSSQTMVPGAYMFYSLKKAELRGRIIDYLKSQQ